MFGGAGDDVLVGSDRWDRMQGGSGDDYFRGFEGRDWIRGGANLDVIDGGAGVDDLHGGNGSDRITTTAGDSVRGGSGQDLCEVSGDLLLFRSCGRNTLEVGPRLVPVMNPGELGIEQAVNFAANAINVRNSATYAAYFADDCAADSVQMDARFVFWNGRYGQGWQQVIDEIDVEITGDRVGSAVIESRVVSAGTTTAIPVQRVFYVYEDGAWRSTNCP